MCAVGVGVAALAVAGCSDDGADDIAGAVQADWEIAPNAEIAPTDRTIPIVVRELTCASGRSAEGRIVADVEYLDDKVVVDVSVRPLPEGECPGNPITPFVVELDEPLDGRRITGERPIQE